jgi:hypothetical protein
VQIYRILRISEIVLDFKTEMRYNEVVKIETQARTGVPSVNIITYSPEVVNSFLGVCEKKRKKEGYEPNV